MDKRFYHEYCWMRGLCAQTEGLLPDFEPYHHTAKRAFEWAKSMREVDFDLFESASEENENS